MSNIREPAEVEIKVGLSVRDLVAALQELSEEDREFFIENFLAAMSLDYLKSIEEAKKDYKEGRIVSYEELIK